MPRLVKDWVELVGDIEKKCGWKNTDESDKQLSSALRTTVTYSYAIADWLQGSHPVLARDLMLSLRSTVGNHSLASDVLDDNRLANWFLRNGFYMEAVDAAVSAQANDSLIRRTAFFRIATCMRTQGELKLASSAATLANNTATLDRKFASPLDEIYVAEALYYFSLGDWRTGANVCSTCDMATKLAFAGSVLPLLSARDTPVSSVAATCGRNTEGVKEFVLRREAAAVKPKRDRTAAPTF